MKIINIIGMLIIGVGFIIPYFAQAYLSWYFFCLGGLLSLNRGPVIRGEFRWAKWAQAGILIHIAVSFGTLAIFSMAVEGSTTDLEYWLSRIIYWIASPATATGQYIFPYPTTHHPDGSVSFQISHFRTVITAFLNIALFAIMMPLIAIACKKIKLNVKKNKSLKTSIQ